MNDAERKVAAELNALRQTLERLTSGLRPIVETQAIHTNLLQQILEAATSPAEADTELGDTLAEIRTALGAQTELLMNIREILAQKVD